MAVVVGDGLEGVPLLRIGAGQQLAYVSKPYVVLIRLAAYVRMCYTEMLNCSYVYVAYFTGLS